MEGWETFAILGGPVILFHHTSEVHNEIISLQNDVFSPPPEIYVLDFCGSTGNKLPKIEFISILISIALLTLTSKWKQDLPLTIKE